MELVYILCSLAAAGLCEEHRATVFEPNPLGCLIGAPAELTRLDRPGWRVAKWRCDVAEAAPIEARVVVASD